MAHNLTHLKNGLKVHEDVDYVLADLPAEFDLTIEGDFSSEEAQEQVMAYVKDDILLNTYRMSGPLAAGEDVNVEVLGSETTIDYIKSSSSKTILRLRVVPVGKRDRRNPLLY